MAFASVDYLADGAEEAMLSSSADATTEVSQPRGPLAGTKVWRYAALALTFCTAFAALAWGVSSSVRGRTSDAPLLKHGEMEVSELFSRMDSDGQAATVDFHFNGRDHHFRMAAYSVYSDDAVIYKHNEHGRPVRLERGPIRTFVGSEDGKRAHATFLDDGAITGLFTTEGSVMNVKPASHFPDDLHAPLLATYKGGGPPHLISYLEVNDHVGHGNSPNMKSMVNFTRNLLQDFQIAVDNHDDFDFPVEPADLPSSESPPGGDPDAPWFEPWAQGTRTRVAAALETWKGNKWWPGCFKNDNKLHSFKIGVISDPQAHGEHGESLKAHIESAVLEASFVYEHQMHIRLKIGQHVQYTHNGGAPDYAKGCPSNFMNKKLERLTAAAGSMKKMGAWHLFTGCGNNQGTVGLAYIGVTCENHGYNTGVNQIMHKNYGKTFLVFAHELGHNFGGEHSFEEGQGATGGIMDYGDGHEGGVYQFNSKYRKKQMCKQIKDTQTKCEQDGVMHSGNLGHTPTPSPTPAPPGGGPGSGESIDCHTISSRRRDGVGAGKKCVFPFLYTDSDKVTITYHECTEQDHDALWCATEVDSNLHQKSGKWGHCPWSDKCIGIEGQCKTIGIEGKGAGLSCQFPFKYKDKSYDACTTDGHNTLWCATKVKDDGALDGSNWGECPYDDFCFWEDFFAN